MIRGVVVLKSTVTVVENSDSEPPGNVALALIESPPETVTTFADQVPPETAAVPINVDELYTFIVVPFVPVLAPETVVSPATIGVFILGAEEIVLTVNVAVAVLFEVLGSVLVKEVILPVLVIV